MKKKVRFHQSIGLKMIMVYILLLLIAIQVIGAYFANRLETTYKKNFIGSIDDRVELLSFQIQQSMHETRTEGDSTLQEDIKTILTNYDLDEITEIQVYDKLGRILGTSDQLNQDIVGNITENDKVNTVVTFGTVYEPKEYYDPSNGHRSYVFLKPIIDNHSDNRSHEPVGAIWVEASVEGVYSQLQEISAIFTQGTMIAIVITAGLGILVARAITKPISAMRRQAFVMAGGDFSKRVNVYSTDEIGQLAHSFNHLNDKLKQSYATTEGERRKLTSVLANMNDGVIATDKNGNIILMNEPASNLIGEVMEKPLLEVLGLEDQVEGLEEIQQLGSMIIDFSEGNEILILKATFSVIQDENNEMNGFITVLSDVTEEEKIERERREFVANVSHELRTPLTTMRSYLESLTDGDMWKDPEIAPKFLSVTQNETDRMIRLVNDLLQLSKMDNKDYFLNREKVEFKKFFEHIIDRFEMSKPEHLHLERKLADKQLLVMMDKDKMTQVLDNVISNAIKYSPEGGTITLETTTKDHRMQIKISDQGVGIPSDQLEKIFERFYRVDKARSRKLGGTGLGLAIAKELIEAHNGEIWANSEEGKGTTITISLPYIRKKWRDHS